MQVIMNPDKEFAASIKKQIKENNGFCPCSLIQGADTKCMCKEFRDMIQRAEAGYCHCGLYQIVDDSEG